MPRQDVPYGGAICRLKERIAEIWDELGKKLHSINGVEGDAAGDVKIVSGDAAIVVTSDQVNHQIEVALDSSQLPAASVVSVNGQTGTVVLDAGDIPSDGNSDVQTDIDGLKTDVNANTSAIAAEALARANADSTLQGNINTVSASIPTAAATAVANDPTVAQLATDVPNKVDKITSGSSLKAYTHTGATQGETFVVDGTAANSIGIRDANGRMQAADPASGATDKTLTTANWISQSGAGAPNNLLHTIGSESKIDLLTLDKGFNGNPNDWTNLLVGAVADGSVYDVATINNAFGSNILLEFMQGGNTGACYGLLMISNINSGIWIVRGAADAGNKDLYFNNVIRFGEKDGKTHLLYTKHGPYGSTMMRVYQSFNYSLYVKNTTMVNITPTGTAVNIADYSNVTTPIFLSHE